MMTVQTLVPHITAEPFEPFRIHTASGRTFEIRHPEFLQVGRSYATVYAPIDDDPQKPHRWEKVSLMLMESIAPLDNSQKKQDGHSADGSPS